ncbi:MAG: hypothetical protein IPL53_21665 [Ignavibacteria bacterium]|nr:hypothetical protein [Ignavibacteria bacterium]
MTTTTSGKNYEVNNEYDSAGNITMLKRYNWQGSITDDFTYIYYPGTNKLKKVTGTASQYAYDTVGNLIRDDVNQNKYMEYDHRNLLTRLRFKQNIENDSIIFYTFFYYDEAGNRTEKAIYQFLGTTEPPQRPVYSDSPPPTDDLQLYYKEIYSRDISGREVAIYRYDEILQYPIYGLDMVGYLNQDNLAFYYLKDHLGSVRTVFDSEGNLISSQDYDPWGHIMLGRQFNSEEPTIDEGSKFKFTSKERDVESDYDYSYARNYNSRTGIFNSVEPILSSSFGWGSYVYCADNPLRIIDPTGEDWFYMYDDEGGGAWEYDEEAQSKNVWTGEYDEQGNKIIEWTQGYNELLFFQGFELQWLQENGQIMIWNAVSGILDEKKRAQPNKQGNENYGPIPEGWWDR